MEKGRTDEELAAQAAEGNPQAFAALVRKYSAPLLSFCAHLLRDPAEAEDRVQEALLKAYANLDLFEPTGKFSSWLFKIAQNGCIDALRARKQWEALAEDPPAPAGRSVGLEVALESLPAKHRAVLQYKYQFGFSTAEIAQQLDTSPEDVRICLHRAIRRLRERTRR